MIFYSFASKNLKWGCGLQEPGKLHLWTSICLTFICFLDVGYVIVCILVCRPNATGVVDYLFGVHKEKLLFFWVK